MVTMPTEWTILAIKAFRKLTDEKIRVLKQLRKLSHNQRLGRFDSKLVEALENDPECKLYMLFRYRQISRAFNIAVAERRGLTRDRIEPKTDSKPDESMVKQIHEKMLEANPPKTTEDIGHAA